MLMVTAEGKCSIKVLRPEEEAQDSDACIGQTSSSAVSFIFPRPKKELIAVSAGRLDKSISYPALPHGQTLIVPSLTLSTPGLQPSRDSESWEHPPRLSECSEQSSLTSMSLNASIDYSCAAAAVAAAEGRADGDAGAPLGAQPAPPGVKKASKGSTDLYAFALAAPRLDAPPQTG